MKKKLILIISCLTIIMSDLALAKEIQNEEVFVAINGEVLADLPMPPIILNSFTLVPAREVFEAIGAKVDWKSDIEQVYITYKDALIVIPIDSDKAYINGQSVSVNTPAKTINNKTMIPLRFVTTALGFTVNWNDSTRIADIITNSNTSETAKLNLTEQNSTQESVNEDLKNVNYDYENDILYIKNTNNIKFDDITEYDNYMKGNYIIEIKGNFVNTFSDTYFTSNSDKISCCKISVSDEKAIITFYENRIIALDITENDGFLCFKTMLPKEKYDKIIVIDAGHGGEMPGAIGNNLTEKDLTLKMALSAKSKFDKDELIKCYLTRLDDTNPSFDERTHLANEVGDAFISIHINSAVSAEPNGTETFCQYANDLGNGLTSYRVAEEMLNQLLNKLGTENRNVKANDLKVLRDSKIPASLVEVGFISNKKDAELMNNNIDAVGQAVYDGVVNLFNTYTPIR